MQAPPLPRRPGPLPVTQPPPRVPARPVLAAPGTPGYPPPAGQPYPPANSAAPLVVVAHSGHQPYHHPGQPQPYHYAQPPSAGAAPPARPPPPTAAPTPALPPRPVAQAPAAPAVPNRPNIYAGQPSTTTTPYHLHTPPPPPVPLSSPSSSSSTRPYIMATVATTHTTADDDSITDLLKETSRDYLKGIGQGVSALLHTDDDSAVLTEEQRRLEREREKEHQRREDEYIAQQKRRVLEEEEQRRRRTATPGGAAPHQTSASPTSHQMTFNLTGSLKKEYLGKAYTVYAIEVVWNGASWTVYRRYKQFNDFSAQAKKASFTFAYALPGKKLQGNLKDHFVEQRQRELQKYVQAVNEKAPAMMSNKKARVALLRFFAPTQVGDKASSGGLPFDLSDLV